VVPIIVKNDVTFADLSALLNRVTWKNLVQVSLTAYSPAGITSYEPTTDDPNIATAESTGQKIITNRPIPSGMIYLQTNTFDYSELMNNLNGGTYGVIYVLQGNKIMMDYYEGEYRPLIASLTALTKGMPLKETFNNFPLHIFHEDYASFTRTQVISMPFDVQAVMKKAMPLGAFLDESVAYATATGIVRVRLTNRGTTTKITTAVVGDFSIIASNDLESLVVTSSTPVVGSAGQYDLVINKNVGVASLDIGDYVTIVYKDTTGTIVNRISNRLDVNVEA
jgi:hypothetical protein